MKQSMSDGVSNVYNMTVIRKETRESIRTPIMKLVIQTLCRMIIKMTMMVAVDNVGVTMSAHSIRNQHKTFGSNSCFYLNCYFNASNHPNVRGWVSGVWGGPHSIAHHVST